MIKWDEWWSVQGITTLCFGLLIIYKILDTVKNGRLYLLSELPGTKSLRYIKMLISAYKQSTPSCPALSLGLQWFWGYCLLYGEKGLYRGSFLFKPGIVFFEPDSVEALMSDPEFIEKGNEYNLLVPWLGRGLITSGGTKWRKHRKLLTPTFHFSILESFISIFQEQAEILVSKFQQRIQEPWIDAHPLLSSCTLDIISETAMGISINAQNDKNSKYYKAIQEIEDIAMYRGLRPWLYPDVIFNLTSRGRKFKTNIQTVHHLSEKIIKEKKTEMLANLNLKPTTENAPEGNAFHKRKPFLELLLEYHLKDPSFTERDIREEVDTFMFAGHDTSAATVNWVLYCLGLYPEIQTKVHEELTDIFSMEENIESKVSRKALTSMKYLECVIKETMRLYPTVPFVLRENNRNIKVFEQDIQAGTVCCIFIYGLHRCSASFPDAEIFDPDRFLPDNIKGRHPYAYVPFSAGPRNCIGQKFAMIEMKIILSSILRRFRVTSLDSRENVILYPNLITRSVSPLRLRFESL